MRIRCAQIMATVVASLIVAAPLKGRPGEASRASVSFVPPTEAVTLHEPVLLEFSIRNGLAEPIHFDLGSNRNTMFIFVIVDPRGLTHRAGPLREAGMAAIGKITLAPGDTFSEKLLLDLWFQFPQAGKYSVTPTLAFRIQGPTGNFIKPADPSPLSIEVGPRDPERLKAVCDRLATVAVSPNTGPALEAATTLSHIVDPIAVPFLAEVARREEPFRSIVVEGLGRGADAYGLDVVLSALGPNRAALERDVRAALSGIRHGVTVED